MYFKQIDMTGMHSCSKTNSAVQTRTPRRPTSAPCCCHRRARGDATAVRPSDDESTSCCGLWSAHLSDRTGRSISASSSFSVPLLVTTTNDSINRPTGYFGGITRQTQRAPLYPQQLKRIDPGRKMRGVITLRNTRNTVRS